MVGFDPRQYVDPAVLAEAQRRCRNVSVTIRVGKGANRGVYRVLFDAPQGDAEAWQMIEELAERGTAKLAEYYYVLLGMKGQRLYVVPPAGSEGGTPLAGTEGGR